MNSTPIKPSEISTMTHEEEELQHDISKLWEQVQQISLSQRETIDELKGDMDGLKWDMDGLKVKLKGDMNDLKVVMEGAITQKFSLEVIKRRNHPR